MMNSKMKKLALAVGVALGGMGVLSSSQAMNLATDGLGQVLIFPYYTVQGGWTTLFNITNTSDQIVAAKVRFHESLNSRDVFDFNVFFSPNDVWNGWVANNGNGPSFYSQDKTCTTLAGVEGANPATTGVPFFAPDLGINGTLAYTGAAADGGSTATSRMNEGYVEVILMASGPVPPLVAGDGSALIRSVVHPTTGANAGVPPGCQDWATAFLIPTGAVGDINFPTIQNFLGDPTVDGTVINPLKGSYNLVNGNNGWTASGSPTTIASFTNVSLLTTSLPPGDVTFAQSYLEPSLNSGNQTAVGTDQYDQAFPVVPGASTIGINAVSALLARTHVINQWSRITQAANGWTTATDWVVTFPTKGFYVDNWPASVFSARALARETVTANTIPAVLPLVATIPGPFAQTFDDSAPNPQVRRGQSCVGVPFSIYNREEKPQLGAGISPGVNNPLCFETNVLTFGTLGSVGTNILKSANPATVTPLPGDSGYMDLRFTATDFPTAAPVPNVSQGLPVIGFAITTRDTGDGNLNEAFLIDHAYSRTTPPANP